MNFFCAARRRRRVRERPALGVECRAGVRARLADGDISPAGLIAADGMSSPALKSLGVPR